MMTVSVPESIYDERCLIEIVAILRLDRNNEEEYYDQFDGQRAAALQYLFEKFMPSRQEINQTQIDAIMNEVMPIDIEEWRTFGKYLKTMIDVVEQIFGKID